VSFDNSVLHEQTTRDVNVICQAIHSTILEIFRHTMVFYGFHYGPGNGNLKKKDDTCA